jgi:hypothetical protein
MSVIGEMIRTARRLNKLQELRDAVRIACEDCKAQPLPPKRFCRCQSCIEWWEVGRLVRPKGHE